MYVRFINADTMPNKCISDSDMGVWMDINSSGFFVYKVLDEKLFFLAVIEHGIEYKDLTKEVNDAIKIYSL